MIIVEFYCSILVNPYTYIYVHKFLKRNTVKRSSSQKCKNIVLSFACGTKSAIGLIGRQLLMMIGLDVAEIPSANRNSRPQWDRWRVPIGHCVNDRQPENTEIVYETRNSLVVPGNAEIS